MTLATFSDLSHVDEKFDEVIEMVKNSIQQTHMTTFSTFAKFLTSLMAIFSNCYIRKNKFLIGCELFDFILNNIGYMLFHERLKCSMYCSMIRIYHELKSEKEINSTITLFEQKCNRILDICEKESMNPKNLALHLIELPPINPMSVVTQKLIEKTKNYRIEPRDDKLYVQYFKTHDHIDHMVRFYRHLKQNRICQFCYQSKYCMKRSSALDNRLCRGHYTFIDKIRTILLQNASFCPDVVEFIIDEYLIKL